MESLSPRIIREVEEILSQVEKPDSHKDYFDWSDPRGQFSVTRTIQRDIKWPILAGITALGVYKPGVAETAVALISLDLGFRAARGALRFLDTLGHH